MGAALLCPLQLRTGQSLPLEGKILQPVDLRLANATADDALVELARSTGVNLLADSSRFPGHTVTAQRSGTLLNSLFALSHEYKLSWARRNQETVLVWSQPDIIALARAIAQAEAASAEATPKKPLSERRAEDAELGRSLARYLMQEKQWDGKDQTFTSSIAVSSLPEELRSAITARAYSGFLAPKLKRANWLSEPVWQQSTLRADPGSGASKLVISSQHADSPGSMVISELHTIPPDTIRKIRNIINLQRKRQSAAAQRQGREQLLRERHPGAPELPAREEAGMLEAAEPVELQPIPEARRLRLIDVTAETAFAGKTIMLEAKRLPIQALLRQLEQQSGVTLRIPPETFMSTALITARLDKMPLAQVLSSLADLYGIGWSKGADGAYIVETGVTSERERGLIALGEVEWFQYWENLVSSPVAPAYLTPQPERDKDNWGDEVIGHVNAIELINLPGVKLDRLPPESQQKLKHHVERMVAQVLVKEFRAVSPIQIAAATLNIEPRKAAIRNREYVVLKASLQVAGTAPIAIPLVTRIEQAEER
jgi:hypothetical protein